MGPNDIKSVEFGEVLIQTKIAKGIVHRGKL